MLNPAHTSLYASALSAEFSDFEEAARYALMQRLMPAIRHDLMGNFQAMGMLAAMLERRLKAAAPDLAGIRETCTSLANATRSTVGSSNDFLCWIEAKNASQLKFDAGLLECLGLLTTELRFQGFVIVNEVSGIEAEISGRALRSVLCAALLALGDLSESPAELIIRAQVTPDRVEVNIDLHPTEGRPASFSSPRYRRLSWRDVEVLAMAESVNLTLAEGGAQLSFPRAPVSVPIEAVVRTAIGVSSQ